MLQLKYLPSNTAVYTTDEFALISPLSADATTEDIASKVNQILDVFNKAPLTDNSSYICQLNCIFIHKFVQLVYGCRKKTVAYV